MIAEHSSQIGKRVVEVLVPEGIGSIVNITDGLLHFVDGDAGLKWAERPFGVESLSQRPCMRALHVDQVGGQHGHGGHQSGHDRYGGAPSGVSPASASMEEIDFFDDGVSDINIEVDVAIRFY